MPDKRQPNQTRRVEIPIHYSQLQLRIPDKAVERFANELRAAGVEISADQLPKECVSFICRLNPLALGRELSAHVS